MHPGLRPAEPPRNPSYAYGGRALVLDPNPTSRSILANQLRDYGMLTVLQYGGLRDARRRLEIAPFDVVLCEMDFPGGGPSGTELLEDLRRENLLPLDTVFMMVTGEATYARVAEAAESALDSYLLKPFNARTLHERLQTAKQRKDELREIFEAIDACEFARAAQLCGQRVQARAPHWVYAARIAAELWLRLGEHGKAKSLLEDIAATKALPWAKLGIARAQLGAQQTAPALRTLESLLSSDPSYVDAYDVMGRVQVEQGDLQGALETYQKAADLTPGSIVRQQKLGMIAFYEGQTERSAKALWRAVITGVRSKSLDFQCLVLLGFCCARQGDSKHLRRVATDLARALERAPQSARLQRFVQVVAVLELLQARQVGRVVQMLDGMAQEIGARSFDVEAACNLLTLLAHVVAVELELPQATEWVDAVAQRFCTTHAVSELLASAAGAHAPHAQQVRAMSKTVVTQLEAAMQLSLKGNPEGAVKALLRKARSTLNPRFVETAHRMLQRHAARIGEADALAREVAELRDHTSAGAMVPPLGRAQLSPGGLSLRSDRVASPDEPTRDDDISSN